jgi:hypothetical protein
MPPPQTIQSSYTWGGLFDLQRRLGAGSLSVSGTDQLSIAQKVSAFAYAAALWPFTFATTTPGQIPCVNGVQDYASPSDLYRLNRAWFRVPTQNAAGTGDGYGTVPPLDDPAKAALYATQLSAAYVGAQGNAGGIPAALTWPGSGSFDIVKRLPVNLVPYTYTMIHQITQQPNQQLLRLSAATAVALSQPYSLELEYQPVRPPVSALTEACWFPDDYVRIGDEGILYELYRFNNDPRAGTVSYTADGSAVYSGQLAVWMNALKSAAGAEREGSVDTFVPDSAIGAAPGFGFYGGWFA